MLAVSSLPHADLGGDGETELCCIEVSSSLEMDMQELWTGSDQHSLPVGKSQQSLEYWIENPQRSFTVIHA